MCVFCVFVCGWDGPLKSFLALGWTVSFEGVNECLWLRGMCVLVCTDVCLCEPRMYMVTRPAS